MRRFLLALLPLTGCGQEPAPPPPNTKVEAEAPKAPPARVGPAVRVARSYRCADGTGIHVSFLADDRTAEVRRRESEPPLTILKAASPGAEAFTGLGYRIDGTGTAIDYVAVNRDRVRCRA